MPGKRRLQASRGAPPERGPPVEKRVKVDKLAEGVVEILRQAEGLNADCREMLIAAVPWLFKRARSGGPRHELQAVAVAWIGETFHRVQEQLEAALEASDAQVSEVESDRGPLDARVAEAQALLTSAEKASESSHAAASTAYQACEAAKARFDAAQRGRRRGETMLSAAAKEKQRLDDVVSKHFLPLKAEDAFMGKEVERHVKALAPLAEDLGLDESLFTALPLSVRRPPGERNAFDLDVLNQLGELLASRDVELRRLTQVHSAAAADCGKEEASSSKEYTVQDQAYKVAAQASKEAKVRRKKAASAVSDTQAVLAAFDERVASVRTAREEKFEALQSFRSYNMTCLDVLRGKMALPARSAAGA